MSLPTGLQAALLDPRVDEIVIECEDDDGYWVYLNRGYIDTRHAVHAIHEDTPAACLDVLTNDVQPCSCDDCKEVYS